MKYFSKSEENSFFEDYFLIYSYHDFNPLIYYFPLCILLYLIIQLLGLHPSSGSNWHIEPVHFLLAPNEDKIVTMDFKLNMNELELLKSNQMADVISLGTLHIIHGDEPTRHRIRRCSIYFVSTLQGGPNYCKSTNLNRFN